MKNLKDFGVEFEETSLANNVKLYSFYKPNSPIYFRVFFYAGSQYDGDKPGLAHFCEHVFASGTEKYPTKDIINQRVQEISGRKCAYTYYKNLWLTIDLADKADSLAMFEIVDQLLNHSLFTQDSVDMEKKVVLAEQTRKISNPAQYIYDLSSSLLFQGTNIENPVLGFDESVKSITRQDLLDYRDKYLINGQVAYFISGDFDQKMVINSLNQINKSRKPINITNDVTPIFDAKKELLKKISNSEQNYLCLGTRINTLMDKKDIVSANIFNTIFGQNNTSRLHKALRSKKGLVYDVGSNIYISPEYSGFSINTNCKVADTEMVVKIVKDELSGIVNNGISEQELEFAKKNIIRDIKFQSETAGYWVEMFIMKRLTSESEPILINEYINILKSVSVKEVNSFAKKYLANKELLLAGIGDFNSIK